MAKNKQKGQPEAARKLDAVRGTLDPAKANARVVVAMTANPGCQRRRVLDAARVPVAQVAEAAGFRTNRGQSPFAIASGNMFEAMLKKNRCEKLIEVLSPHISFPSKRKLRIEDCGQWRDGNRERVRKTSDALRKMVAGDKGAADLLDHPMLALEVAGTTIYLEPDALALKVADGLQLVEIKSYAVIDGQAPGEKVKATAAQSAVYLWALRQTLERLGLDPDLVQWSVILVAPKNFGRTPTAHVIPLRVQSAAIRRTITRAESIEDLAQLIPTGFTLDLATSEGTDPSTVALKTREALSLIPCRYVPECMSSCDLAMFCREEAVTSDSPSRLGRQARDIVGNVQTVSEALHLARLNPKLVPADIADTAEALREGATALDRARAGAPAECGLASPRTRARKRATKR